MYALLSIYNDLFFTFCIAFRPTQACGDAILNAFRDAFRDACRDAYRVAFRVILLHHHIHKTFRVTFHVARNRRHYCLCFYITKSTCIDMLDFLSYFTYDTELN